MFAKITTTTIIECTKEGFDALQLLDKEAIVSKLDVSGAGRVEIASIPDEEHATNTEGTMKVDDEWDDEFCEVYEQDDDDIPDAPEDDK